MRGNPDQAMESAKSKVLLKYQELIQAAVESGDLKTADQVREWSQLLANERILVGYLGLEGAYEEYGKAIKQAADDLRAAYSAEIKRVSEQMDFESANQLTNELIELRLPTEIVSFQVYRSREYLNHLNLLLRRDTITKLGEKMNSSWEITSGLSNPTFVSIRSVSWPNSYVDHLGFRVRLTTAKDDAAWRPHATWIKTPGLASDRFGVSFKAVTHPDRYLRVRDNGEVWLDVFDGSERFRTQATFHVKPGLYKLW